MIKTGMVIGAGCAIEFFASNLFFRPSPTRRCMLLNKNEDKLKKLIKENDVNLKYGVKLGRLSFLITSGYLNRNLPFFTQNLPILLGGLASTELFRQQTINSIEHNTKNLSSNLNNLFNYLKKDNNKFNVMYSDLYEDIESYSWTQASVGIVVSMVLSLLVD